MEFAQEFQLFVTDTNADRNNGNANEQTIQQKMEILALIYDNEIELHGA